MISINILLTARNYSLKFLIRYLYASTFPKNIFYSKQFTTKWNGGVFV